jgi:hypothetical protein
VTKFGEFLLIGRMCTEDCKIEHDRSSQNFGPIYFAIKAMGSFRQKICWATFWTSFSANSSGHRGVMGWEIESCWSIHGVVLKK